MRLIYGAAQHFLRPRLEGSVQLAVTRATLARRIDAYYQSVHEAVPLAMPDTMVFSVCDLAFLMPEFRDHFSSQLRDSLTRRLEQALRRTPRWVCISHSTASDLIRLCGVDRQRVSVGWPAVDPELQCEPSSAARRSWRKSLGITGPFVLHVGTLQPRKNIVRLIRACGLLRASRTPVQLILVGERGWLDGPTLDAIVKAGERVRYLGSLPDDALRALLAEARVLCIPSLYEGFGFLALEGMAAGAPIAAANTSSLPEVLGEAALFFNPLDEEEIAAALDRLWQDADLRGELACRGKARADEFTWDDLVDAVGTQVAADGFSLA